jgi:hypothetical protein
MSFIIKKLKVNKNVTIDNIAYTAGQFVLVDEALLTDEFVNETALDQKNGINSIDFILLDDTVIVAADQINSMSDKWRRKIYL